MATLQDWKNLIGKPFYKDYQKTKKLIKKYSFDEFDGELYLQSNGILPSGEILYQEVFVALPKNIEKGKNYPAVAVPFYNYNGTLGMNVETGEKLNKTAILYDLVKRGYIGATGIAYHETYIPGKKEDGSENIWDVVSTKLLNDNPDWTGMGKFINDTQRLLDILDEDERVDSNKLGLAGHSLGGKMAFYTACLDDRVKALLVSDFGLLWDQTNWDDKFYWGKKVFTLMKKGLTNVDLLKFYAPKPFCLIAGYYDDDNSVKSLYNMESYKDQRQSLFILNHARGHKPPQYVLDAGYGFMDLFLK